MSGNYFTCPLCGMASYNLNDVRHRYCGRCHVFIADELVLVDADMSEYEARRRRFYETDVGKALHRFESDLGRAWITDQRDWATAASMKRDWGRANASRDALIAEIEKLFHAD